MKKSPDWWFSDFDSVKEAVDRAAICGEAIFIRVNGYAYKVYPGGRIERRPWDDNKIDGGVESKTVF